ncbi:hypothetical protein [Paenibacillus sp. UNC499MF]|uniref:hypothetical protein n=1 Tax=Paenibacillus sp. UNC499MF TaxID=1502751 RepID=UPI0011B013F8|nr:hypothetical protein [Paenibacillus sp. UNC499MF]
MTGLAVFFSLTRATPAVVDVLLHRQHALSQSKTSLKLMFGFRTGEAGLRLTAFRSTARMKIFLRIQ